MGLLFSDSPMRTLIFTETYGQRVTYLPVSIYKNNVVTVGIFLRKGILSIGIDFFDREYC